MRIMMPCIMHTMNLNGMEIKLHTNELF